MKSTKKLNVYGSVEGEEKLVYQITAPAEWVEDGKGTSKKIITDMLKERGVEPTSIQVEQVVTTEL